MSEWEHIEKYKEQIIAGEAIVSIWVIDDVKHMAEQMGKTLTHDQQIEALGDVEHNFDASHGISWDSLEYAIDQITEET